MDGAVVDCDSWLCPAFQVVADRRKQKLSNKRIASVNRNIPSKFAIDIVFLDKNLKVVKITPRLKPSRMSMSLRARSVLELAAGAAERKGIEPGDVLEKREADAEG